MPSQEVANVPLCKFSRESCSVSAQVDPLMSCTPLSKAAKPAWDKQLARPPRLVVCIKFQFSILILAKLFLQAHYHSSFKTLLTRQACNPLKSSTVMEDVRGFVWVNRLAWSTAKNVGIMRMHLHFYSVRQVVPVHQQTPKYHAMLESKKCRAKTKSLVCTMTTISRGFANRVWFVDGATHPCELVIYL